jgi:hypothetical protein
LAGLDCAGAAEAPPSPRGRAGTPRHRVEICHEFNGMDKGRDGLRRCCAFPQHLAENRAPEADTVPLRRFQLGIGFC